MGADAIAATLRRQFYKQIEDAIVYRAAARRPFAAWAHAGGFRMMIEDRGNEGLQALQEQTDNLVARQEIRRRAWSNLTTVFRANTPQLYVDVDRTKCKTMGVALSDVFDAMQVDLGGLYVNDFNQFGRTWQVNAQADIPFRMQPDDMRRLQVRNSHGDMVPLAAVAEVQDSGGPFVMNRYNMYPAASINGSSVPGMSSGEVIKAMEKLAADNLPTSMGYEWTELMYLQLIAGNTTLFVFAGAVVLVFLVLAGQYESWSLPLAVIFVVPMCVLCSVIGVAIARMDINIFTQIGFVVLGGAGQQKRHPHRGIRQVEAGSGHAASRGHARGLPVASAADHDDLVRLYLGRGSAGDFQRRRRRNAAYAGHRRLQRHVGRDHVRHLS